MARYGMVIDLHKCVGCGSCALACKTENNTPNRTSSQSFNWADYHISMEGEFPNLNYQLLPVLCNHCTDAPCVAACPVTPKAMFKSPEGLTLHNNERCIGCRLCQRACPYSVYDFSEEKDAQYSVISYNDKNPVHPFWRDNTHVIAGCTASGEEVVETIGTIPPNKNIFEHDDYEPVRRPNIVEKCMFCDHRRQDGLEPYCVASCPAGARVVGDFDDPDSEVSKLIKKYPSRRLKNNKGEFLEEGQDGTKPNVHYIRSYNPNS